MKIKNSLVFAFLVWMEKGDHTIRYKKNHFVMKKEWQDCNDCLF